MHQPAKQAIKTCQIIAAAMMIGVAMIAVITLTNAPEGEPADQIAQQQNPKFVSAGTVIMSFMGAWVLLLRFLMRKQFDYKAIAHIKHAGSENVDPTRIVAFFQARTIPSFVLLEFVALFSLLTYFATSEGALLLIELALFVLMVVEFPTENKFRKWVRSVTEKSELAGDE